MLCNQCGLQNPDEAASCTQCGNLLTTLFPAQPAPASMDGSAAAVAPAVYAPEPTVEPPPGFAPVVTPQTDGKAVASLICGILSVTLLGILTGLPAIILGHISRSKIKKSMGKLKGEGMALAGLIMGYISVALTFVVLVVLIIAAIAIPNLLKARTAANEASAVASVRTVVTASTAYQAEKGSYPVSLEQLGDAKLIDPMLAGGTKSGYRFALLGTGERFFVAAVPVKVGSTGLRSFCSAEDQVVRSAVAGQECTPESPALQ